jgi:hypothetical protein
MCTEQDWGTWLAGSFLVLPPCLRTNKDVGQATILTKNNMSLTLTSYAQSSLNKVYLSYFFSFLLGVSCPHLPHYLRSSLFPLQPAFPSFLAWVLASGPTGDRDVRLMNSHFSLQPRRPNGKSPYQNTVALRIKPLGESYPYIPIVLLKTKTYLKTSLLLFMFFGIVNYLLVREMTTSLVYSIGDKKRDFVNKNCRFSLFFRRAYQ